MEHAAVQHWVLCAAADEVLCLFEQAHVVDGWRGSGWRCRSAAVARTQHWRRVRHADLVVEQRRERIHLHDAQECLEKAPVPLHGTAALQRQRALPRVVVQSIICAPLK
jgi:hypothetical protein